MVPRVFKTNVGDIFTTNTVADELLLVTFCLLGAVMVFLFQGSGDVYELAGC